MSVNPSALGQQCSQDFQGGDKKQFVLKIVSILNISAMALSNLSPNYLPPNLTLKTQACFLNIFYGEGLQMHPSTPKAKLLPSCFKDEF